MKRQTLLLASLVAGLVFAGCTTAPKYDSDFSRNADFTKHKTFNVVPPPSNVPGMDPGAGLRLSSAAISSATAAMTAKGYIETKDPAAADVALVIKGMAVPKIDISDLGYGGGLGWGPFPFHGGYGGNNIRVDQYDEGTLTVEIFEARTKQIIWVGWVTDRVREKTENDEELVSSAVKQVLASYPAAGTMPVVAPKK